jgi:hypothetical protein
MKEMIMHTSTNAEKIHKIDDLLRAIHQQAQSNVEISETDELQKVIRTMWDLLTPCQCVRLTSDEYVQTLFDQDNRSHCQSGPQETPQGTLGGFGTEELEEWQKMVRWPTP